MNTHGFELKSFGLEIVNDLPGYWTGLPGPHSLEKLKDSSESVGLGFPRHDYTEISAWHVAFNLTNHERHKMEQSGWF